MSAPYDQQNVTWHEFSSSENLTALVKRLLPELDVELLAANKPSQRHKGDGPPREKNSYFIYKSHRWIYYKKVHEASGEKIRVPEITKKITAEWHSLPSQEQKKWRLAAILQQLNHRKANPNYKYSPNRGTQKKVVKRRRADGEGGRTRKRTCSEKRAEATMDTQGMILEPFSVHPQMTDDSLALNSLIDDMAEFQALLNEFTNLATVEINGAETPVSGETPVNVGTPVNLETPVNVGTPVSVEPLVNVETLPSGVSAEQLSVEAFVGSFSFVDGMDASNVNANFSYYNVDENQFANLDSIYNAMPSPVPTPPMLTNDVSPLIEDMSPVLSEASSDTLVAAPSFYGADIIPFLGSYACDAVNENAFEDFVLFDCNTTLMDPAANDWWTPAATDSS